MGEECAKFEGESEENEDEEDSGKERICRAPEEGAQLVEQMYSAC